MEPKEVLTKALAAVEEVGVPDDLRELAFAKAVDLYAGTASPQAGRGQQHQTPPDPPPPGDGEEVIGAEGLAKIASFYNLTAEQLTDWFEEDDNGELKLLHAPEKLAKDNANLVRYTCLLLACGRKVGGYDETVTTYETLRAAIDGLGLYDPGNFSKQVAKMTDWFTINGKSKKMTFRIKPSGRKVAKEKMGELLSQ